MSRRLAAFAGSVLLAAVAPRTVAANTSIQATFDTVDSVEIKNQDECDPCSVSNDIVVVTGILTGGSTATTRSFDFGGNTDKATRCEHLAVIAMSKPGKYQFSIGSDSATSGGSAGGGHGDCRLTLVTP